MKHLGYLFALAVLALPGISSAGDISPADYPICRVDELNRPIYTGRVLIRLREGAHDPGARSEKVRTALDGIRVAEGLELGHVRSVGGGFELLELPTWQGRVPEEVVAQLKGRPDIAHASLETYMYPAVAPNDPKYSEQWNLHNSTTGIRAESAWAYETGDGVTVAVLDSGYRPHPDLDANMLAGHDFIADAARARDGDGRDSIALDEGDWATSSPCGQQYVASTWHGTQVAGVIAAVRNNAIGIAGVAPGAKILPVRVLGEGGGYESDALDAISWASTRADILNLSFSSARACSETGYQAAINAALAAGVKAVVVAAGNSSSNVSGYAPASCNNVITVGATSAAGSRASYSNYGAGVDLVAPGGDDGSAGIVATSNTGTTAPDSPTYRSANGTSLAAPHVSGVAALLLDLNPNLTVTQLEARLKNTAKPFPAGASCTGCGAGLLDAKNAILNQIPPSVPGPITVTNLDEENGNYTLSWSSSSGMVESYVLQERAKASPYDVPPWTTVYNGSGTSKSFTNKPSAFYEYRVKAKSDAGDSAYSAIMNLPIVRDDGSGGFKCPPFCGP